VRLLLSYNGIFTCFQNTGLCLFCKVLFAPRQAGTYVAQLELMVSLISRQPSLAEMINLVTMIAVAEKPLIQVKYNINIAR